jgi:hypothetical protein
MKHIGHIEFNINHALYYVKQSAYLSLKILSIEDLNA